MHEDSATGLTRIFVWVKHEVKEVGLITLYFLFCFSAALILKKLFLASYDIEVYVLSTLVGCTVDLIFLAQRSPLTVSNPLFPPFCRWTDTQDSKIERSRTLANGKLNYRVVSLNSPTP